MPSQMTDDEKFAEFVATEKMKRPPYIPTELEMKADALKAAAVELLKIAADKLEEAADVLNEEEKKHDAISPANQYNGMRYTQAATEIDGILIEMTGKGRVEAVPTVTNIRVGTISVLG